MREEGRPQHCARNEERERGGSGEPVFREAAESERERRYRRIFRSRSEPHTFYQLLGMQLRELREGGATFSLPVSSRFFNAGGMVHGGVLASLADASMAAALATVIDLDRETMATVEMKINYMYPVTGGELRSEGKVVQRGRSIAVVEACLTDGTGRMVAKAMGTFAVRSREKGTQVD